MKEDQLSYEECEALLKSIFSVSSKTRDSPVDLMHFATALDEGQKGYVSREDFTNVFDVIDIIEFRAAKRGQVVDEEGRCRKLAKGITGHPIYDCIVTLTVTLNLLAVFFRDYDDHY